MPHVELTLSDEPSGREPLELLFTPPAAARPDATARAAQPVSPGGYTGGFEHNGGPDWYDGASGDDGAPVDTDGGHGGDAQGDPDDTGAARPGALTGSLAMWARVVPEALEPCLVLDVTGAIVAVSSSCRLMLGLPHPREIVGRGLLDGVLHLVDFTAAGVRLVDWELERIPPLLALATNGLARGLMRVRVGDKVRTVDAVTTPLRDTYPPVGSMTFFKLI